MFKFIWQNFAFFCSTQTRPIPEILRTYWAVPPGAPSFLLDFFTACWAMKIPVLQAASLCISPVTWVIGIQGKPRAVDSQRINRAKLAKYCVMAYRLSGLLRLNKPVNPCGVLKIKVFVWTHFIVEPNILQFISIRSTYLQTEEAA